MKRGDIVKLINPHDDDVAFCNCFGVVRSISRDKKFCDVRLILAPTNLFRVGRYSDYSCHLTGALKHRNVSCMIQRFIIVD